LIFDGEIALPKMLTCCSKCGKLQAPSSVRKKVEEIYWSLVLVASLPDLAGAGLEPSERPDIKIHLNQSVFGLEVTNIVRGGPSGPIQQVQWIRRVEWAAYRLWHNEGRMPVWFSLSWRPDPPRSDVMAVARLLVDGMADLSRRFPSGRFMLHFNSHDLPERLTPYPKRVYGSAISERNRGGLGLRLRELPRGAAKRNPVRNRQEGATGGHVDKPGEESPSQRRDYAERATPITQTARSFSPPRAMPFS